MVRETTTTGNVPVYYPDRRKDKSKKEKKMSEAKRALAMMEKFNLSASDTLKLVIEGDVNAAAAKLAKKASGGDKTREEQLKVKFKEQMKRKMKEKDKEDDPEEDDDELENDDELEDDDEDPKKDDPEEDDDELDNDDDDDDVELEAKKRRKRK